MIQKPLLLGVLFFSMINLYAQETPDDVTTDASQYNLFPGNITVVPGATVNLHVYYEPKNDPGKIVAIPNGFATWLINGHSTDQNANEGTLTVSLNGSVVYKAPPSTPSHNPVQITATYDDIASADSIHWRGSKTRIILYAYITVLDEPNYFYIGSSGTTTGLNSPVKSGNLYLIKEPMNQGLRQRAEKAFQANDQWNVHVT